MSRRATAFEISCEGSSQLKLLRASLAFQGADENCLPIFGVQDMSMIQREVCAYQNRVPRFQIRAYSGRLLGVKIASGMKRC